MSEPTVRPVWTPDDYWNTVRAAEAERGKAIAADEPDPDSEDMLPFRRSADATCACCGAWPLEACEPGCLNLMTPEQQRAHRDDVLDRTIAELDRLEASRPIEPPAGWSNTDYLLDELVEQVRGRHRAATGPKWTWYAKTAVAVLVLVLVLTVGALWAASRANAAPANCHQQPWLYGGLFGRMTTRTLCDGPIRDDGSWLRHRNFYSASYYKPYSCSWSYGSGSCSGGYQVAEFDTGVDEYVVTPETVLADEPGHLG